MCALTIPTLLIETKDASKDDRKLERKEGRSAVRAGKKPDSLTQGGEYTQPQTQHNKAVRDASAR